MTTSTRTEHPRIVVGIDGSEQSKHALRWAAYLAETSHADLVAVGVWHLPAGYATVPIPDDWNPREEIQTELWGWADASGSRTLDSHVKALRAKIGADRIRTVHGVGFAVEERP